MGRDNSVKLKTSGLFTIHQKEMRQMRTGFRFANFKLSAFVAGASLALLVGCDNSSTQPSDKGAESTSANATPVRVDGSSTVYPVTEAVAEEFKTSTGMDVTVGLSGTGGGFKKFMRNETDISNASRPISKEEMEQAKEAGIEYLELPICFDALTVVVHPSNTFVESMTVAELKKIWEPDAQGTITTWNQIRPEWPEEKITLFGAGSDSGTFDYFTEAIVGKAKASRGDYNASEDDNTLVQGVQGSKFAMGYLPYSYYAENKDKLKAVAIDWEKDELPAVGPSEETVMNGTYNPLSRPLFIYVNKKSVESREEVKKFVAFYLDQVDELSKEVNCVPLPASAYDAAKKRFEEMKVGTVFGGTPEVGLTIDELLSRETKQ
jgi:phosphate transport system substrate-binding protein